jgi:endonuclease/exonuclease/phosphatase family metal-dependent hydrolase
MKNTIRTANAAALAVLWLAMAAAGFAADGPRLRILTFNVWSGLDYVGFAKFGEYEPASRRETRFAAFLAQAKALNPDVIFIQEANFAGSYARRLAAALGLDEIHQVVNGGIKLGPLGLPSNLKEGNAILAKPGLGLRRHDDWKLSGPFGFFGDTLTIHFSEAIFVLAGKIVVGETPIYLVNVHFVSSPPDDEAALGKLRGLPDGKALTDAAFARALVQVRERTKRRADEMASLIKDLAALPADTPVIVGGDFNVGEDSAQFRDFLASSKLIDTLDAVRKRTAGDAPWPAWSWDPSRNDNIGYSSRPVDASGEKLEGYDLMDALSNTIPRRIDFILLNPVFREEDALAASLAINGRQNGVYASDHFGITADVDLARAASAAPKEPGTVVRPAGFTPEFLPIAMGDTDIGFGYGLKSFLLNPLGLAESFDITLFNSTKGERWYRFVFSLPDFEIRQGRIYPWALDLTVDYDKMIRNNYFGVGNASRWSDRETYTREPIELSLTLSRGFTSRLVGQLGLRYKAVTNSRFAEMSALAHRPPDLNAGTADYGSVFAGLRYDSRDSTINPSEGFVAQAEAEMAPRLGGANVHFQRLGGWLQYYSVLFLPKTVFAIRFGGQSLFGSNLPVQVLLPLGGNQTLRGSPQDRYLDKSFLLINAEIRFPIVGRLGGVVGWDTGKVWPSLGRFDLKNWASNPTLGLRLAMKTFIVRLDAGLGQDSTGIYFKFGQLF